MARPEKEDKIDDRVHIRMKKTLKTNAQIKALEKGFTKSNGGFSAYIIDLLKKDGVKED